MWYRFSKSNKYSELIRDYFISNKFKDLDAPLSKDNDLENFENDTINDEKPIDDNWLENAKSWIGTPYVFGGNSKNGIDCSAFIQKILPDKNLPRTANEQMKVGNEVSIDDTSSWSPGDRVYFDMGPRLGSGNNVADHTGVYIGNNQFIQASSSKGVTISDISPGSFYFKKLIAVKR